MEDKWLYYNGLNKNFFNTTRLRWNCKDDYLFYSMKKILILGGSSYVGGNLITKIDQNDVLFTYNRTKIEGGIKFDSTTTIIEKVIDLHEVNSVVILLGDANPESCIEDVEKSKNLNVCSIKRIIDTLSTYNIKVMLIKLKEQ